MFYHELYYCRFFSQIVWYEVLVCNHVISRQCWGSIEFFFSVNLHYSRVLISSQEREMLLLLNTNMAAVTSRANHQRHQLRINKAANSSRAPTRQSNFCHSNNYLLFIPPPPRFWLPEVESHVPAATKDQGSFAKQERQPWERGWSTSNCNRESIHVTPLVDFRISWYIYASASYPDVSLSRWKRARKGRREGDNGRDVTARRRFACFFACRHSSYGPLQFITSLSRFELASTMRKTKLLRRGPCMDNKSMGFSTKILLN